jgi:hypothetical protein
VLIMTRRVSCHLTGLVHGTPLAQQLVKEMRQVSPMQDVGDNSAIVAYMLPL